MKQIVVVFAKYPEPGKVKTRLGKDIGKKEAASLYGAMLKDIISNISGSKDYDVAICFTPKNKEKEFLKLLKVKNLLAQKSGDLGERMHACFEHYFSKYSRVIIIGSDVPTISKSILNKAFSKLSSKDIVLGKAEDGGYYLIGMKQAHDVFSSVEWSTKSVLSQTLRNSNSMNLNYVLLPSIIEVDTKKDLLLLKRKASAKDCEETFKTLSKLKKI